MQAQKIQFVCDFDSTITKQDTIKTFLEIFTGEKWLVAEKLWLDGKIGSRECLKKQVELLPELSIKDIDNFLCSKIDLADGFFEFTKFVKENGHSLFIISDGLDYFIRTVLIQHGIFGVPFYSNRMLIKKRKIAVEFPYSNEACLRKSGTCKCEVYKRYEDKNSTSVYIGDGLSDCCVSNNINFVFAKDTLLEHCKKQRKNNFREFNDFKDILNYFQNI